ncbi:polyketide synthase [Apiospora kogelbergensis]|uniref:polyketide synthase n=1 Tax=Apiospora kogelbergensis TaxID=1337665 RepID=UPI00312D8ADB
MSPRVVEAEASDGGPLEPIAICGMSCRLPGGVNSDSSFWQMLVEKRTGQTAKVPESRFNIDAHLHENLHRPGSFNVPGGYFLDGSPEDFDPTFFNITPVEAQWLDPQQRKMLEVTFECLTSAGLTLDAASGTNTAVFVGSFTSDYQQMSTREPDFRHNYAATGVDTGIISARIGNTFNLNGPSFTINTACSSSVYAMHNACHALRARDCDGAIVGGVNLIITVDQHMNTAKLGILSPTSTCHTFDAAADGYGRAEGAGAVYLKRLSDAIRCGDPIRGVIRSTAVNTNGKVPGMGITHPSVQGQERVVRMAYEKANLDPNLTAYAELHGTGTPVGDPIEVRAISNALNDTRSPKSPLIIGAVKPNIGHSEAASGIFAVMKAALMTEASLIPGVALLDKLNPEILEDEWNIRYRHAQSKRHAQYDHSTSRPVLLCLSAHDKITLGRVIADIAAVASDYYAIDLAHTLNLHRTTFAHRAFTVLREGQEIAAFDPTVLRSGAATAKKAPGVAFLFTGQGAQWIGMGRVAMSEYPVFADVICSLDRVLAKATPAPTFKLADLLLGDPAEIATCINDPVVVQPLCTAIQIALVDLFSQWNIEPVVSVGHSSGEIAAAYAAGLVSAPHAIIAAYCRGSAVQSHSGTGSMLAVGLGKEEIEPWLPADPYEVCIACVNSPQSVTLSGRCEAIAQLRESLASKGIFARELKTGRAYHSPHMANVATAYESLLATSLEVLGEDDQQMLRQRSAMISSVTGEAMVGDALPDGYFSMNLRQRVCFDEAVQKLGASEEFSNVRIALEIGPHAALAGPFKQICKAAQLDRFTYVASMARDKNDADQLLSAAGSLFLAKYPVSLEEVNAAAYDERERSAFRKPRTQYLLVDLPPYPWNYERSHWAEPRASAEQRSLTYPRHDLLGSRVSGLSSGNRAWRNVLRVRDVPWLRDHSLGGSSIFPAAGYLSMAIEAVRQVHETEEKAGDGLKRRFHGVTLRDIDIKTTLNIPDSEEEGIETLLTLCPAEAAGWYTFTIESCSDQDEWKSHCSGRVHAETGVTASTDVLSARQGRIPVVEKALSQCVPGHRWYSAFERVGFHYGPAFQQLQHARTERGTHQAAGAVTVRETSGLIQGESRALLHPATIDACLHLVIISVHAGKHREMPWGVVPTRIEEVTIALPDPNDIGDPAAAADGKAFAWTDAIDGRRFNTHVQLMGKSNQTLLDIKNLTCVAYEAAVPVSAHEAAPPMPFSTSVWKPDLCQAPGDRSVQLLSGQDTEISLMELVELVCHRQPIASVLIRGSSTAEDIESIIASLPSKAKITVGFSGELGPTLSEKCQGRVVLQPLESDPETWKLAFDKETFDILVVNHSNLEPLQPLVGEGGTKPLTNGASHPPITLLSFQDSKGSLEGLKKALESTGSVITQRELTDDASSLCEHVVIDDTDGQFYSCLNRKSFDALKALLTTGVRLLWLTKGVLQGHSLMAASRIVLLDYSEDESPEAVGRAIVELVAHADTRDSGRDTEFWLDKGVLHISRVLADDSLNRRLDEGARLSDVKLGPIHEGQVMKVHKINDEVGLELVNRIETALAPDEIELRVSTSQDPLAHSGGVLMVGTITKAGDDIPQTAIGKRAVGFVSGDLTTAVRTSVFATMDGSPWFNEVDLLETLDPLSKILDLSLNRTQLQSGCPLIALPGPPAAMSAIVGLSKAQGWNLSIVVRSTEKDHYQSQAAYSGIKLLVAEDIETIATHIEAANATNHPVHVFAQSFDDLSREVWRRMPVSGNFVVLHNESGPVVPDATPFARGASFVTVPANSTPSSSLLTRCMRHIEQNSEIVSKGVIASDLVAQAGSSDGGAKTGIINLRPSEAQFKIIPQRDFCRLSSDAAYLLVGCLGGLGRSLTKRMIELGARNFVFISRSEEILKTGASAQVFRADVSDEVAIREVVTQVAATHRIQGVVHAAMVLNDGMFERMDYDSFQKAVTPKARGAVSLHKALQDIPDLDLDFFVLTSSISALLGNMGQSNYAAANGVLESLARYRTARGLPATALVLPMVLDVGVVAETDGLEEGLVRKGLYGIDEHEMLRGFETAMAHGRRARANATDSTVVMGMEAARLGAAIASTPAETLDLYWYRDARFCHVRAAIEAMEKERGGGNGGGGGGESFAEALRATLAEKGYKAAVQAIAAHIAKRVSIILMIPVDGIELDGPSIASYGLDSMIGAEMRTWLFKEFGLDYPFQQLLAPTLSFTKLAIVVADKMGIVTDVST